MSRFVNYAVHYNTLYIDIDPEFMGEIEFIENCIQDTMLCSDALYRNGQLVVYGWEGDELDVTRIMREYRSIIEQLDKD